MPKAETSPEPFTQPEGNIPFHFEEGELPEPRESIGDRFGEFTPEIGAHQDAADAQPSLADLAAREKHIPLTDDEREAGLKAVEEAKRLLGYN